MELILLKKQTFFFCNDTKHKLVQIYTSFFIYLFTQIKTFHETWLLFL